jgi:hypothetical protein
MSFGFSKLPGSDVVVVVVVVGFSASSAPAFRTTRQQEMIKNFHIFMVIIHKWS